MSVGGDTVAGDKNGSPDDYSFAFAANENNEAIARSSAAFGSYNKTYNPGEFVCGNYSEDNRNAATVFLVGGGVSPERRHNAFEVRTDHSTGVDISRAFVSGKSIATEEYVGNNAVKKMGNSYVLYANEAGGNSTVIPYRFNKTSIEQAEFPLMFQPMTDGRMYTRYPTDEYHAANKGYIDSKWDKFNLTNGEGVGSITQKVAEGEIANIAKGRSSSAFGDGCNAEANKSFVAGTNNTTTSTAHSSAVFGQENTSNGVASLVFGNSNTLSKDANYSLIGGKSCTSNAPDTITVGNSCTNNRAMSLNVGYNCTSTGGNYGALIGNSLKQGHYLDSETIIGRFNEIKNNLLFSVGNGDDESSRSNAIEVLKDGRVKIYGVPKDSNDAVRKLELDTKYDKTGGVIGGEVVITGDLTVNGTQHINNTENLDVKNAMIYSNSDGATLASNGGLGIKTNSTDIYGIVYDPVSDSVKLGLGKSDADGRFTFNTDEGNPITVRDDDNKLTNNHLLSWNSTNRKLVDSGKTIEDFVQKDKSTAGNTVYSRVNGVEQNIQFTTSPSAYTIAYRDAKGIIEVSDPEGEFNATNKRFVENLNKSSWDNFNLENGTGQGSLIQKNVQSSTGEPYTNVASGPASIAFGKNTKALGNTDFVIGQNNTSDSSGSFVGGINCSNTYNSGYSIVFGDSVNNQYATKSVVMGSDIQNSKGNSVILGNDIVNPVKNAYLIGRGLRSQDYISIDNDDAITILGKYNKRATTGEINDGTSFIIGNGTSEEARSNAIKLSDVKGLESFIEPKT